MQKNTTSTALRVANAFMGLVFLVAAAVQYNDPNGLIWGAFYGIAAVICAFAAAARLATGAFPALVCGVALVGAVVKLFEGAGNVPFLRLFESWKMTSASVEKTRELGGLLIVAVWMGVLTGTAFNRHRTAQKHASDPSS
jgi:hypothetical protein